VKSAAFSLLASAVLASSICAAPAHAAAAAPVPIEAFFRHPAIAEAAISPSGRLVAMVAANKDDIEQLVVLDAQTRKPVSAIGWKYQDVSNVHWVSERRLVYQLTDYCRVDCASDYSLEAGAPGWYAVDVDGSNPRKLTGYGYMQSFDRETDEIVAFSVGTLVRSRWSVTRYLKAFVLDTRTGEPVRKETSRQPLSMLVDKDGEPRFVLTKGDDRHALIEYRPKPQGPWETITEFDTLTGDGELDVVGFSEPRTAYVVTHRKGTRFDALYAYDVQDHRLSPEPLVDAPGFDIAPRLMFRSGKLIGARIETDAEATVWFDPDARKVQQQVDALLPGAINRISYPARPQSPRVLVVSFSDTEPNRIFLFDTGSGSLVSLGRSRPDIDPAQMGRRDFVHYRARDGRDIPGWVTTPRTANKAPQPAVVLVHGGPFVRGGQWEWNAESQFLASRGYVVLEPEFRGSAGFGSDHFRAGWKQWGLAMQDDIADMARWAIAKGLVDPQRICIAGASYGGYATLMGLVRDPQLYRCGVDWLGPTDIGMIGDALGWSDSAEAYRKYGMPMLIADPEKDAAQVKQTSPLQQAARVKAPLLMAYGELDQRVPIEQGERFRDAAGKINHDIEWVTYKDEGHGFRKVPDNLDFWRRAERLLGRAIGAPAP
jgi:dipeptidyl aminopeptidase/acylaminoacyl peptidase